MVTISQSTWGYIASVAGFFVLGGLLPPISAYGRLFTSIQQELNTTSVQAGWIGSVVWSGTFLASPLAVTLVHYVGYRTTAVLGAVTASSCYFLTSFMTSFVGILISYGLVVGLSCGLSLHAVYSTLFKTLPSSYQSKGAAVASSGVSLGGILVILAYEKIVPLFGWRATLQMTSFYCAVVAVPAAFLITPYDEKSPIRRKSSKSQKEAYAAGDYVETSQDREQSVPSISQSKEDPGSPGKSPLDITDQPKEKRWIRLLPMWRTWLLFFGLMLPAMAWSVYWVNIISFYESIAAPAEDIFIYAAIQSSADLVGRIFLVLFDSCLPRIPNLVIASNFVLAVLTVLMTTVPTKPFLLFSSFFIGLGRGWYCVLPMKVGIDLLQVANSDQAVTVSLSALGVGFLVGTLPAGAIYDVTGHYHYAFVLNAGFFLIGGALLVVLQVLKEAKRKRRLSQREMLSGIDH